MDDAVQSYIDRIPAEHRALFDRLHQLIVSMYPDAVVFLSYQMPTYKVGNRRLHVGAWQHGISIYGYGYGYGWKQDRGAAFVDRHPALNTSKGTIRLRPEDATEIADEELTELLHAALDG